MKRSCSLARCLCHHGHHQHVCSGRSQTFPLLSRRHFLDIATRFLVFFFVFFWLNVSMQLGVCCCEFAETSSQGAETRCDCEAVAG